MSNWDALKVHSMTQEKYDESDPFVPESHGSTIGGTPTEGTGCGWLAELTGPDTGRVGAESDCNEAPWYGSDGPGIQTPLKRIGHIDFFLESADVRYLSIRLFSQNSLARKASHVCFVKTNECLNIVQKHFPL